MKYCRIFIFVILIFLTVSPAFAKNKKSSEEDLNYEEEDTSLREIRKLIRDTNYDEALMLLTNYIKQNPDNFDNAQHLVAVIMEAKKKYAETLDRLIVLISTDPDNDEEIYNVTRDLRKIEKKPKDTRVAAYVDNLYKVVTFSHNQKESRHILEESSRLVSSEKYLDSLSVIQEGFVLYREEYEDTWGKESDTLKETDEIISDLKEYLNDFALEDFNSRLNTAVNNFINSLSADDYESANMYYPEILLVLSQYADCRQRIYTDGQKLIELNNRLSQMKTESEADENELFEASDASYLPFMTHFIYGDKELTDSGIIPTIDKEYITLVSKLNSAVFACVNRKYAEYASFFKKSMNTVNNTENETSNSSVISNFVSLENKVIALEALIYTNDELSAESTKGTSLQFYDVLGDYVENLIKESERIYVVNKEINQIASVQENIFTSLDNTKDSGEQPKLVSNLLNSTAELGSLVGVRADQEISSFEWSKAYKQNNYNNWHELESLYTECLAKIFSDTSTILNSSWTKISNYYIAKSDEVMATVSDSNVKAKAFSDGFDEKIGKENHKNFLNDIKTAFNYVPAASENAIEDIKYKYPDITQLMTVYSNKELDSVISEIQGYRSIINDNFESHEQWKLDEGISKLVSDTKFHFDNQIDQLNNLKKENLDLRSVCSKQTAESELLKSDAEYDLEDAESEIKRENFENAREKLKSTSEKLVKAFDIQTDEAFSEECDEKIRTLGMQITRMENEKVVREVRELKTLAKNAYVDGRFDEAEKYLSQAAARWAVTNSEEDSEIVNLQAFVNTAMSAKTGREILPSAPQYEEMTQLLTVAYNYYDNGRAELNKGNKTAANEDFEKSEESIKQLQMVYPLHREAALLTLRIDKLQNPDKFNQTFDQKIENARMMCKSKDENTRKEGYANLQDYYELDPNYKGLKNIIYQAEFDVGIRKNVDNSNVKKSKTAYDEANRLYKAGNLDAASKKINEALSLNPDDTAAQKLKDNITIAIGGTKIPLSTDAQKLYSKSYDCFVQNNMDMAEFYLNRLASLDKRFMNDDDVQRLKAKIDALK